MSPHMGIDGAWLKGPDRSTRPATLVKHTRAASLVTARSEITTASFNNDKF
jgi:hypothetical protein